MKLKKERKEIEKEEEIERNKKVKIIICVNRESKRWEEGDFCSDEDILMKLENKGLLRSIKRIKIEEGKLKKERKMIE